jgi:hypothetical protein
LIDYILKGDINKRFRITFKKYNQAKLPSFRKNQSINRLKQSKKIFTKDKRSFWRKRRRRLSSREDFKKYKRIWRFLK